MMFTIHELDREGNPTRELASTQFADIAVFAALAIAKSHWPEESHSVQHVIPEQTPELLICEEGIPYKQILLRNKPRRRWTAEEVK